MSSQPRPEPGSSPASSSHPGSPGLLLRLGGVLATWVLLDLALPGIGRPGGFGHLAFVALVPWALVVHRPGGRLAFPAEWLATATGMVGVVYWLQYVVPVSVVLIPLIAAFYMAWAGVLLRLLARRWPLALAVPAAWTAGELVRGWVPVPASFLWHRLGHMAHDTAWLVGSSRVWGSFGLTWVFAAFSGMLADLWLERRGHPLLAARRPLALGAGLLPLLLAILLGVLVPAPETEPGPTVLVVQPGIEQEVKSFTGDPYQDLFLDAAELTMRGIEELEEPPDLVLWGESSLPVDLAEAPARQAIARGVAPAPWARYELDGYHQLQLYLGDTLVQGAFLGQEPERSALGRLGGMRGEEWLERSLKGDFVLPEGTCFAAGAEEFVVHGSPSEPHLRRRNSYYVWGADGQRSGPAPKLNLVPGGESLMGVHELPFALEIMMEAGGYIPDFVPGEEAGVLAFTGRDGRPWHFGVAICFDNVFDEPFLGPTRAGEGAQADFTVVASNEAWYRESHEMDQLVAMARFAAVMSGRSVVRATNSGVSCVLGPDGRDVAVLEVGGRRKMVAGTLAAVVPVPVAPSGSAGGEGGPGGGPMEGRGEGRGALPVTPYARHSGPIQAALALLVVVLAALAARGRVRAEG